VTANELKVGIYLFEGVEELDFAGPWEVLSAWSRMETGPAEVTTVAETADPLRCAHGLTVTPDHSWADAPAYDKPATTHWSTVERLKNTGRGIEVREDARYVDAGQVVTLVGVPRRRDQARRRVVARIAPAGHDHGAGLGQGVQAVRGVDHEAGRGAYRTVDSRDESAVPAAPPSACAGAR
jgi:putative intracellular protease/amidase